MNKAALSLLSICLLGAAPGLLSPTDAKATTILSGPALRETADSYRRFMADDSRRVPEADVSKGAIFIGFVLGVANTLSSDSIRFLCIPADVTDEKLPAIVLKYIDEHPGESNRSGAELASAPLLAAYPCTRKP